MRFSRLGPVLLLTLFAAAQPVQAKRQVVSLGVMKRVNGAIVVATLDRVEVKQAGYAFRLKIAEVLRGRPEDIGKEVQIDRCSSGQNGQWERGEPVDGMKVVAYLCRGKNRAWELPSSMSEVVEVLEEPGKPPSGWSQRRVQVLKKNIALMDIAAPEKCLEAVKRGLRDPQSEHQRFCVAILGDLARMPEGVISRETGVDLSDVLAPETALSLVWEVYTAADTPLDTVSCCDQVFNNFAARFDREIWKSYPPRYRILRDAIKRHVASGSEIQNHVIFADAVRDLGSYPEHARETYQVMLDAIGGKVDIYKLDAASLLELAYHPHTVDPELKRLNEEVWAKLIGFLADKNKYLADGAAMAIGGLAVDFAEMGEIPDEILSVLDGRTKPQGVDRVAVRLVVGLREVRAIQKRSKVLPAGAQGAEILAAPWEHYVGRKVLVRGDAYPDKDGGWIRLRTQVLGLALRDQLPSHAYPPRAVAVGTLTKSYDIPVFRYKRGEPFGKGLPVPEDFSLHDASRRFALVEVSWRFLGAD